jgi:hypothetical protein
VDIDAAFLPVAVELIDRVFPTDVVYHRLVSSTYDPPTGNVVPVITDHAIKAGVLSRGRVEAGGPNEVYELVLWVHHDSSGLQFLPKTGDTVTYDSTVWKVNEVIPTYSSKHLIASKLKVRAS